MERGYLADHIVKSFLCASHDQQRNWQAETEVELSTAPLFQKSLSYMRIRTDGSLYPLHTSRHSRVQFARHQASVERGSTARLLFRPMDDYQNHRS